VLQQLVQKREVLLNKRDRLTAAAAAMSHIYVSPHK
jgi:hypothetical protein